MSSTSAEIPRLLAAPREVYLRQNETRIRSVASNILAGGNPDPAIVAALDAVHFAEDIFDIHDITAKHYSEKRIPHRAESHQRYANKAMQLKLRALDQLAHLVI